MQDNEKTGVLFVYVRKSGYFCKIEKICANEENKRSDEDINSDSLL